MVTKRLSCLSMNVCESMLGRLPVRVEGRDVGAFLDSTLLHVLARATFVRASSLFSLLPFFVHTILRLIMTNRESRL